MSKLSEDRRSVTVRVPISIRKRGGRKIVLTPQGKAVAAIPFFGPVDLALVKAVARGFRWREMLENGTYATIGEIAAAEKINASYVGRLLRLTLLAPATVETILEGRHPGQLTLATLMLPFPVAWQDQAFAAQ